MLFTATAILAALVGYLALVLIRRWARSAKDPPSPGWLPMVGSAPYVSEPMEEFLSQDRFASEPVVTLYYGVEKLYVLNTHAAMKEVMVTQGDKFLARPSSILLKELTGEWGGIITSSGDQWRDYRRFSLKTLRDFGLGRQGAEEIIALEAKYLCDLIAELPPVAMDTVPLFSTAVSNVICQLVFGSRLASEDPEFERILQVFRQLTQSQSNRSLNMIVALHAKHMQAFRPLARLALWLRRGRLNVFNELFSFCAKQAEQHKAEMHEGDFAQPRDYIEAHLRHQESHPNQFNDARLTLAISDLFLAGTDTTSHTLRWGMLLMLRNPDVAERVFQEIQSKVGLERAVTTKDRASMHYTMAVLEEIQRLAFLAPMGVMHCSTEQPPSAATSCQPAQLSSTTCTTSTTAPTYSRSRTGSNRNATWTRPAGSRRASTLCRLASASGPASARAWPAWSFSCSSRRCCSGSGSGWTRSLDELLAKVCSHGGGIRAPTAHKIIFEPRTATTAH